MSHPHQTTPITSDGTLDSSTKKKRGRPSNAEILARKREEEREDRKIEASKQNFAAVTDEDRALDAELEKFATQEPSFDDDKTLNVVKKVIETKDLLSELVEDYKPASTIFELEDQVHLAKRLGAKSIEATSKIIRHFCGDDYKEEYFMYKDFRVYLSGTFEESKAKEGRSMEQRVFGMSKSAG